MMTNPTRLTGRLTSHWVRIDGQELHYLRSTGPQPANPRPAVLIHGMIAADSFLPVAELLAPFYRVYVPELPGIGGSEAPAGKPGMHDLVEILARWMDKCELEDAHLAAQSFGCNLAVEMAILHPQRVASLVLQALTLEPERRGLFRKLPHWMLAEMRELPRSHAKKAAQQKVSREALHAMTQTMLKHPIEERLPKVPCPTLVLQGSDDLLVSRDWAHRAVELLPQGRLCEISGATHTMNAMQPDAYADAFQDFETLTFSDDYAKGGHHATQRPTLHR